MGIKEIGVFGGRRHRTHGERGWSESGLGGSRLAGLETGETAVIEGFDAGHTLRSRLCALGFTPDEQVTMIQNFGSGPVIVKVRDTRIALGRGEASKVRVRRAG